MSATLTADRLWTDRRRRVAELRGRQGFARQLLDLYGALLGVQEKAFVDAAAASPDAGDLAAYVAEVVVPGVVDVTLFAGPDRLRSELIHRLETEHPRQIVARWIAGEDQALVDRYLARASLGPVLEALDPRTLAAGGGEHDPRHCPECGGPPQLSFSAVPAEDLATGPRFLECARCGVAWGYPRMTCAGCGAFAASSARHQGSEAAWCADCPPAIRRRGSAPSFHTSASRRANPAAATSSASISPRILPPCR